jgi:hypothetical protein
MMTVLVTEVAPILLASATCRPAPTWPEQPHNRRITHMTEPRRSNLTPGQQRVALCVFSLGIVLADEFAAGVLLKRYGALDAMTTAFLAISAFLAAGVLIPYLNLVRERKGYDAALFLLAALGSVAYLVLGVLSW